MTGGYFNTIAAGIPWTITLTVVAFSTGVILGVPVWAMLMSRLRGVRWAARLMILTFRSIPPIVWLFLIFFGVGSGSSVIGPFQAAWIGLGLITAANMAEIYRGAFAALHPGQREAAIALGMPFRHRFLDVIAPQMVRVAIPSAATFAISLLKDTAIASTIGVHEIAFQTYHLSQTTFHSLDLFAIAGLLYIAISLPIAWLAHWADRTMRRSIAR